MSYLVKLFSLNFICPDTIDISNIEFFHSQFLNIFKKVLLKLPGGFASDCGCCVATGACCTLCVLIGAAACSPCTPIGAG